MQDEFIAAADLPDVVDFAPDSLLPRWLAQLAERGDDLSADAQRELLRHYVAACPARTSLALIKAKQRDASAPKPHGLSADEVTARGDFSPGLVRYVLRDSTASPSGYTGAGGDDPTPILAKHILVREPTATTALVW